MTFDNELKGVLFKNKAKRPGRQDSDYRGSCEISGVPYYIDAWINEPKGGGDKFMALRFKPKVVAREQPKRQAATPQPEPFNDDCPF